MEKFRESTKYILWILIISFGLLWALADTQVFDAMMAGPRSLGEVNGKAISFEAYNQKVQSYSERYRYETGDAATSEMRAYYEDLAWDELVLDVLIKEKMEEIGIKVSDQEVIDMITGPNPDPFIAQQFRREDGSIDRNALNAAITAPENTQIWITIEQQLRDNRRREKLANYLQASVVVSDNEINEEFINRNSSVSFDYIRVAYNEIPDSALTVNDADLRAFYKKEINRYQRKKTWKFNYVEFDLTPTKEDTVRTFEELQLVREDLTGSVNDSLVFLQHTSTTPYAVSKVDKKEVKDSYKPVLSVGLNETTEVIKETDGSLHILKKVAESKTEVSFVDYSTKVIADPLGTVDERAKESDDFAYWADENDFAKEAERRGLTLKSGVATEDTPFIAGLGQSRQAINWLKASKVGEVTLSPIEMPKAFVVMELTEVQEAGARAFEEVRPQVERLYKTELRKTKTAEKIAASLAGKSTLTDVSIALGKELKTAETVRFNADVIPGIGREPKVIGVVSTLEPQVLSSVIEGEFGAFVIQVKSKTMARVEELTDATRTQIKTELEQKRNSALSQVWVEKLKSEAEDRKSVV